MKKIKIYYLNIEYIKWLLKFENSVMRPKPNNNVSRPYVGVVLEINNRFYFAPLTHKGKKWVGYDDHVVLGNKKFGAVCLNCMVPINKVDLDSLAKRVNFRDYLGSFNDDDRKYGLLLFNQYRCLNRKNVFNKLKIAAIRVYINTNLNRVAPYSCNFSLLEKAADKWTEKYKFNYINTIINQYKLLKI